MTGVNVLTDFVQFNRLRYNERKMTYAVSLLQKGLSVGEVAAALGFSNQNYFSVAFKRVTGQSPSAFKKEKTLIFFEK